MLFPSRLPLLLGLVAFLFCLPVFADILMIDINSNPEERAAAQSGAKARHEQVIFFPDPTPVETADYERKRKDYQDIVHQLSETRKDNSGKAADRKKKLAALEKERKKKALALREAEPLSQPKLSAKLAELQSKGVKVSSLIISGHDGNGNFFGKMGSLSAEDLKKSLSENPEAAGNIRALYLWGCYTATYGACEAHWNLNLPQGTFIVGFNDSAPLGDKPAGLTTLEKVLAQEKNLTDKHDKKVLTDLWKRLGSINQVNASICTESLLADRSGVRSFSEMSAACNKLVKDKKLQTWSQRISCYRDGNSGCENIPPDPGELRSIYSDIQNFSYCRDKMLASDNPEDRAAVACWPDLDELIRLVKYKSIAKNFSALHGDDIKEYDDLIDQEGLSPDLKLGDVSQLSRKDLNRKLTDIQVYADQELDQKPETYGTERAKNLVEAEMRAQKISRTLSQLKTECVDMNWVESGASSHSSCISDPSDSEVAASVVSSYKNKLIGLDDTARQKQIDRDLDSWKTKDPDYQENPVYQYFRGFSP